VSRFSTRRRREKAVLNGLFPWHPLSAPISLVRSCGSRLHTQLYKPQLSRLWAAVTTEDYNGAQDDADEDPPPLKEAVLVDAGNVGSGHEACNNYFYRAQLLKFPIAVVHLNGFELAVTSAKIHLKAELWNAPHKVNGTSIKTGFRLEEKWIVISKTLNINFRPSTYVRTWLFLASGRIGIWLKEGGKYKIRIRGIIRGLLSNWTRVKGWTGR
jgi:hypothetical protein